MATGQGADGAAVRRRPGGAVVLLAATALAALVLVAATRPEDDAPALVLTPEEAELALEFSPLPPIPADPTNAVADDPDAARLGQAMFFDPRFSRDGDVSCSTCHQPDLSWTDGRPLARGVSETPRHAMTLWNVAWNRWFFWDGRKDSLWSQALAPFEDAREHATSRLAVVHAVADDAAYAAAYEAVFGPLPDLSDAERFPAEGRPVPDDPGHPHAAAWDAMTEEDRAAVDRVYSDLGKAIAAFERRIVSRRAPFDVFVEGVREGDPEKQAAMSPSAQRGFALFAGRGRCLLCHDGPTFSDLEFHSNRVPVTNMGDGGRAQGIQDVKADPFNAASAYADDGGASATVRLAIAPKNLHFPGEFKTPTLRNVVRTAPYMHEGQLATLDDVLAFYSTMETALPPDPTGERFLQPRHFDEQELADLRAFLEALTDEELPEALKGPPAGF